MSAYPVVAGIDPGFANFGFAAVELLPTAENILHIEVIRTKPSPNKRRILTGDDNNRRAQEIARQLMRLFDEYRPLLIAVEEMSYPPNASAAGKMMMARGIVIALSVARPRPIPIRCIGPQELKLATAGSKKATKVMVAEAVYRRYPESRALTRFLTSTPKTKQEHGIDAIGAVVATLGSDVIAAIRQRI